MITCICGCKYDSERRNWCPHWGLDADDPRVTGEQRSDWKYDGDYADDPSDKWKDNIPPEQFNRTLCEFHGEQIPKHEKGGQTWFSHKDEDDNWL